jgi:tetratricopeptide (TPR) repeat protein
LERACGFDPSAVESMAVSKLEPYLTGVGVTVVGITLIGWFLASRLKKSSEPAALILKWIITVVAVGFWFVLGLKTKQSDPLTTFLYVGVAAMSAIFVGIMWAPSIGDWLSSPLTHWFDGGDIEPELRPLYSIAIGYRKRGNYDKSIAEIRRQLAQFPEDFEGWMMLAEVQHEDLKDLPTALETLEYILTLPQLAPKNTAYALGRVADWQMHRSDRDAARAALQRIIERLPETEEAQIAAQRIAHLASAEHLADMHEPRVIALKHSDERIGLRRETVAAEPVEDAATTAQRYVEHLRDFPLDNEVRERLAVLYATEYKRLDLAESELEQLVSSPNQSPKNIAHWLNLLADFQVRLTNNVELARQTLQRIVDLYPKSAMANTATVRMSQLKLELNQNIGQRTLKLGTYEQNIGLKRMTSSGPNEG